MHIREEFREHVTKIYNATEAESWFVAQNLDANEVLKLAVATEVSESVEACVYLFLNDLGSLSKLFSYVIEGKKEDITQALTSSELRYSPPSFQIISLSLTSLQNLADGNLTGIELHGETVPNGFAETVTSLVKEHLEEVTGKLAESNRGEMVGTAVRVPCM